MHLDRPSHGLNPAGLGNRIDVSLDPEDYPSPTDNGLYGSYRMMECTDAGTIPGWSIESKVNLIARKPYNETQKDNTLTLHLDNSGDLYFTIWKNFVDMQNLMVNGLLEFNTEIGTKPLFLTHDPENIIALQGIQSVRLLPPPSSNRF